MSNLWISVIYQLFENAVMDNIIRVNPASNAFRNFRKTAELNPACREPLTAEQQVIFIDYIYASEKYGRMANLFTVLLGTGMRIGEALGLRWRDCDFEEGIIHVTHALLYKREEDGNYRYRISAPKTEAGFATFRRLAHISCGTLFAPVCVSRISTLRCSKMLWGIGTYALQWKLTQRRSETKKLKQ